MVDNEFLGDITKVMQCLVDKKSQNLLYELYGKISWNMRDFDYIFEKDVKEREDVAYMVLLCDWILESHNIIFGIYAKYTKQFTCNDDLEWCSAKHAFRALRSFMLAHPLATDQHPKQGYDGSKRAIDIIPCQPAVPNVIRLSMFVDREKGDDFFISWYNADDDSRRFEGHSYQFLYDFSHATIDRVRELLTYLSKIRKKDLYKF